MYGLLELNVKPTNTFRHGMIDISGIKLVNLPSQIKMDEVYDFCYGYRVIPGSVSLQYNKNGMPKGSATVVFESRQEALTAVRELSGRPIGNRKIQLVFV